MAPFYGSLTETRTVEPGEKSLQHNETMALCICIVHIGSRDETPEPSSTNTHQEKDSSWTDWSHQSFESCRCSCHFYLAIIHLKQSGDGRKQQITFCKSRSPFISALPENYYETCSAKVLQPLVTVHEARGRQTRLLLGVKRFNLRQQLFSLYLLQFGPVCKHLPSKRVPAASCVITQLWSQTKTSVKKKKRKKNYLALPVQLLFGKITLFPLFKGGECGGM